MTETAVSSVDNLIWIAVVAVALSLLLRSRGIGTALPLLGCGIVIGLLPIGPTAPAAPEAIQALVLAPLVFGEALSSSYIDIKKVRRPVLALAILLVAATTLIVGGVVAALLVSIPAAMALALGAILAPTDAVAVANAARRANLPAKIVSVLEGESLVNDATGLTALRVAVVAAVAGSITIAEAGAVLAQSVAVGLAIGVVSGWVLVLMLRHSSDVVGFGGLLLIAPFPIYMLTEELGGSAILAIVTAALMASHASHSDPSYRGRLAVATVWRQITFILQSIAFLLLGIELPFAIGELPQAQVRLLPLTVLAVTLVLIVTRMGFVFGMFGVDRWVSTNPTGDWRSAAIVGWAGARGPVSALAAFSLPFVAESGAPIPYRDFVVATALCVIMVTLMISPTLGPLARVLAVGVVDTPSSQAWVRSALARAALAALESAETDADRDGEPLSAETVRTLRHQMEQRLHPDADNTAAVTRVRQLAEVGLAMAEAEQRELIRLRTEAGLPDAVVRPLMTDIDQRIAGLRAARKAPGTA